MAKIARTSRCGIADARARLLTAQAYLEVADRVLDERAREEFLSVSTGLAVLAGIAASDSICCARNGLRHRGDDHRAAATLLEKATPDGNQLAATLSRLINLKDAAHYGVTVVSSRTARDAVKWAARLVKRARDEVER